MDIEYFIDHPMIPFPEGCLVVKNKRHQIVASNPVHLRMSGKHHHSELIGLTDEDMPWHQAAPVFQMYEDDVMGGRQYTLCHLIRDAAGQLHHFLIRKNIILDAAGCISGTVTHAIPLQATSMATDFRFHCLDLGSIKDERLRQVCCCLSDNPANPQPLNLWAAKVGVSSRTLARLFQSELSMTFVAFRQSLRIYRSLPDVLHGKPLSRVAQDFGYSSQSAYSKIFKQVMGVSPKRFVAAEVSPASLS
ncbi:AraC family transcriptional regulator [Photobacterium galatheae]|uniref:HTH araC/xylS-type domain-containing protein n=1 Tax=Photobacterium galatheae TaxID=1654360 RepID=A0A066RPW1_9GAMM|nr:helix-turn-helix domain-containing protein [Photobacterium galatheae]KDM92404.1 hypothetical protein EA58_06705 [Photobacterium galatheae]MCM0150913.1 helix-turn-helix domain-containing protein [Photobacterium galatheae]